MGQFNHVERLAAGEALHFRLTDGTYIDQVRRIGEAYGYSVLVSLFPTYANRLRDARAWVITAKATERCLVDEKIRRMAALQLCLQFSLEAEVEYDEPACATETS